MTPKFKESKGIDYKKWLKYFLEYKYLFVVSIALCLVAAYFINKNTVPLYMVKTSLLIQGSGEPVRNSTTDLIYGEEGVVASPQGKSLANEISILTSYPFIYRTVKALNLNVSYYRKGSYKKELYNRSPFLVNADSGILKGKPSSAPFQLTILDNQSYLLDISWTQNNGKPAHFTKRALFGEPVIVRGDQLIVTLTSYYDPQTQTGVPFEFIINDPVQIARQYKDLLSVRSDNKESSVLDILLQTNTIAKEIDFLNEFTRQFIQYSLENRSRASTQTLQFINQQIATASDTLSFYQSRLAKLKSGKMYSEASNLNARNFDELDDLRKQTANLTLSDNYYSSLLDNLNQNKDLNNLVAPSAVGITDPTLNSLISDLVSLQVEKNTYLNGNTGGTKNPHLREIDDRIRNIKATMTVNIRNLQAANRASLNQTQGRMYSTNTDIRELPQTESEFASLNRLYQLNQSVYLLLLQKRVEAGVLNAATTVDCRVLEPAFLESAAPIKPKKANNYLLGFLCGLAFPILFVIGKTSINTRIVDKSDIAPVTSIPLLGTIGRLKSDVLDIIVQKPKSAMAEAFRKVRSNINFLIGKTNKKVFLITSSISGEGKSFCAANLAISMALLNKKTLLINADLRKPNKMEVFKAGKDAGLSNYLSKQNSIKEIIQSTDNHYLDYIGPGFTPSNSAELLASEEMSEIIRELRKTYDYIIIDTSPLGMVTDPFILMQHSDFNIIIVRQNVTPIDKLSYIEDMYKEGKLKEMHLIFNNVKINENSYGYYEKDN